MPAFPKPSATETDPVASPLVEAEAEDRAAADSAHAALATGAHGGIVASAEKGAANGVATLGADGKILDAQLGQLAITDVFTVASQAAMLALTAERGDVAIRSDLNKSFILSASPASTLANWKELLTPTDVVTTVNGRQGTVTGLAEQSALDTEVTRATAAEASAVVLVASKADTSAVLLKSDNLASVASAATARTNLGLGTAATTAASAYATAAQGTAADAAAGLVTAEATARATGDSTLTANTQTGDYTLVLADAGKVIEVNAATSKTVTVPPNSSVAFPVGSILEVLRYGAGAVVIAAGSGVTIRSRSSLLSVGNQYSTVVLRKRATDEWVLVGDLS